MRRTYSSALSLVCSVSWAFAAAPAMAGTFSVLYTFQGGTDGAYPGGLVDAGGTLYGTTFGGGSQNCGNGCGTIFAIDPATGIKKIVYAFTGGADGASPGSLIKIGEKLYGTTNNTASSLSTVFSANPRTGVPTTLYSFQNAEWLVGLANAGGTLYGGVTYGSNGNGFIYALDLNTGAEKTAYTFQGGSDGSGPVAAPIKVGHHLFGTTQYGGRSKKCSGGRSCGTVYALDPATGAEQVVHAFTPENDGATPEAGLLKIGSLLYGTTSYGEKPYYGGTVFVLDPATGSEHILYAFHGGSDGAVPYGGLINIGGTIYGTTKNGGDIKVCDGGCGTLFSVVIASGTKTTLHMFEPTDGALPSTGLININGSLYGTTSAYWGSVFKYSP